MIYSGIETESQSKNPTRFLQMGARMASVVSQTVPLELLAAGEHGIVVAIDGNETLIVRLQEMGLREGVQVCMVRPGSPCILEIQHQRFSFRFDDLATVLVEVVP